jgi:MscS family membrane protein
MGSIIRESEYGLKNFADRMYGGDNRRRQVYYSPRAMARGMRRSLALLLALSFLLILAPAVSAEEAEVFDVEGESQTIVAGDDTQFTWLIYNNDTVPYLVELEVDPADFSRMDVYFNESFFVLQPWENGDVVLIVETDNLLGTRNIEFQVDITITELSDRSNTFAMNRTAELRVLSLYGTTAGENKVFGIWDNPLPAPFDSTFGAFGLTIIGWILIALFIYYVVDPIVLHYTKKTKNELDDKLVRNTRGPIFALIILYGLESSLEILNLPSEILADVRVIYHLGVIAIGAIVVWKVYYNVMVSYAHQYARRTLSSVDDVLIPIMEQLGKVLIPVAAVSMMFSVLGYDLTVLLAGAGIVGLVIAFAAQDTLSNFFSGLFLLFERPFKAGDLIEMEDGTLCEVKKIGMRTTTLYNTFDPEYFVLPNNEMANKKVVNVLRPDPNYKVKIEVGVAYGSDVALVKKLMLDAAMENSHVLKDGDKTPWVRFISFGDSALVFKLFTWVDDVNNQWLVASDIRESIDAKFRKAGIEIPFPQRTVWLRKEN